MWGMGGCCLFVVVVVVFKGSQRKLIKKSVLCLFLCLFLFVCLFLLTEFQTGSFREKKRSARWKISEMCLRRVWKWFWGNRGRHRLTFFFLFFSFLAKDSLKEIPQKSYFVESFSCGTFDFCC